MRVLYLIPARGGSKGLPGKNILPLCGKPLVAWSIETALEAAREFPGKIVVSTDDKAIADVADQYGARVPFMRPAALAADTTPSMDVVLHAIRWYAEKGEHFDLLAMLEPTSPQRDAEDISRAIRLLVSTDEAESIVGVTKTESAHPAFLVHLDRNRFISPYNKKEIKVLRRQDLDDLYFFEGSLYISKVTSLIKRETFYHEKTLGYEMPKWKSFEVDDLVDSIIIESLMNAKMKGLIK